MGLLAVVTGAGTGIGRTTAIRIGRQGSIVAICDKDPKRLAETSAVMREEGMEVLGFQCDVGDWTHVRRFMTGVVERYGKIDVLVNNAGVSRPNAMDGSPNHEIWHQILKTNLDGVYYCSYAALQDMRDGGRIVNLSSILGKVGAARYTAYCASKHGVIGFTRALALEVAPRGITVNSVCPGWVDTEMARADMEDAAGRNGVTVDEFRNAAKARVPLGKIISPDEVAELVCYLISPEARNVTGQAFGICGGMVML